MESDPTEIRRMLGEYETLLWHPALQVDRAGVAGAVVNRSKKIHRVLKPCRQHVLVTGKVPAGEHIFALNKAPVRTMCPLIGRGAVRTTRVGG